MGSKPSVWNKILHQQNKTHFHETVKLKNYSSRMVFDVAAHEDLQNHNKNDDADKDLDVVFR